MNMESNKSAFQEKFLAACCHISGIFGAGIIIGIAVPYIVWQAFKGESSFIDANGKEAFNFQMTLLLVRIPGYVLTVLGIGFLILAIIEIISLVFSIVAAIRAFRGQEYSYPVRYRFIK